MALRGHFLFRISPQLGQIGTVEFGLIVYAFHKSKAVAGPIFTKLEAVRLFFVCSFYTEFNENPTYGLVVHKRPKMDGRTCSPLNELFFYSVKYA
jgi:hypothetical protein